jgi:hypothetical protein
VPETSASIVAGNGEKIKPEDKTSKMEGLSNKALGTPIL